MTEKNIREFIDTLTEEQRAAVLACKDEEELAQVLDDHDVEIPDEMLADVTGGKCFIPALLASIMIVSGAGAMASIPASAAELTPTAAVEQASPSDTQLRTSMSVEDFALNADIDAAGEAFTYLCNVFPDAGKVLSPFKPLFCSSEDDPNPFEMISKKLDKTGQKLEDMIKKLEELNSHIDSSTAWMEGKAELAELKANYCKLTANLEKFAKDVYTEETNEGLNKQQKIIRLAMLTDSKSFGEITACLNVIRDYMDGSSKNVSECMLDLLYKDKAAGFMIEKEAYHAAYNAAQELMTQYLYAVALVGECQRAADAVCVFTDADAAAAALGDLTTAYNSFDAEKHSKAAYAPTEYLAAAEKGAASFKKHNTGTIIFKDTKKEAAVFGVTNKTTISDAGIAAGIAERSILTPDQIRELASYLRTNYPGTSIYDFLEKYDVLDESYNTKSSGTAYILTDSGTTSDEKEINSIGITTSDGFHGYRDILCTTYVKAINIYDPNCEEKTIEISSYVRTDGYTYGVRDEVRNGETKYTQYYFFELHNDLSEGEWCDLHPGVPYSYFKEWKQFCPTAKINDFRFWRDKFPKTDVKKFEDYPGMSQMMQDYSALMMAYPNVIAAGLDRYVEWRVEFPKLDVMKFIDYLDWRKTFPKTDIEAFSDYLVWKKAFFNAKIKDFQNFLDWKVEFPGADVKAYKEYLAWRDEFPGTDAKVFKDYLDWKKDFPRLDFKAYQDYPVWRKEFPHADVKEFQNYRDWQEKYPGPELQ